MLSCSDFIEGNVGAVMTNSQYTPPEVWSWDKDNEGEWARINRPTAGAKFSKDLPTGRHPLQLYSMGTPNGQKVTIMLEELLALNIQEAEYDAHLIKIGDEEQFSSGFVELNPNSKIPALFDTQNNLRIFESGHILLYLAEKFGYFLSSEQPSRTETLNWLFWLQGSAPYLGGGFGHFFHYAPIKIKYAIDRFSMEAKRQLDVLDQELANKRYLGGDDYSIADMATWPWYGNLVLGEMYDSAKFLQVQDYKNLLRWAQEIKQRPAVQRGYKVNRTWGDESEQVPERHDASDI